VAPVIFINTHGLEGFKLLINSTQVAATRASRPAAACLRNHRFCSVRPFHT